MYQNVSMKEDMVKQFFSENGKIMCLELLKQDQSAINQWIANQIDYRDKLEKKQFEEHFEINRQRQIEILNQQIMIWLSYCQTVEHTVKILKDDFLKTLQFDIDHWTDYQNLKFRCGYLESILRVINNPYPKASQNVQKSTQK
jgi:predicted house-cleaning noncanonical NTP pyrophosphatase (MazG superfamily)